MARKPEYTGYELEVAEYVKLSPARTREVMQSIMYIAVKRLLAMESAAIRNFGAYYLKRYPPRTLTVFGVGGARKKKRIAGSQALAFRASLTVRRAVAKMGYSRTYDVEVGVKNINKPARGANLVYTAINSRGTDPHAVDIGDTGVQKPLLSIEK